MNNEISTKIIDKVLIYVLCQSESGSDLLVFRHRDFPEAGIQVPAGTMEPGETAEDAAKRELMEEAGLNAVSLQFLGVYEYYREDIDQQQRRYIFVVNVADQPDPWTHFVKGVGDDKGMAFEYFWQPLPISAGYLAGDQGRYLDDYLVFKGCGHALGRPSSP